MCANALNKLFWLLNEKILLNKNQNPFYVLNFSFETRFHSDWQTQAWKYVPRRKIERLWDMQCSSVCLFIFSVFNFIICKLTLVLDTSRDSFNWWHTQSTESFFLRSFTRDFDLYREHSFKNGHMEFFSLSGTGRFQFYPESLIYNNFLKFEKNSREIIWQQIWSLIFQLWDFRLNGWF